VSKKATTKDELLLLKLYEFAMQQGDPCSEIDRYVLGRAIGQNDKGVDNIVKHLAQANFIKKGEGAAIYLTSNGLSLIKTLLS
jgi:hypothetical protein